MEQYLLQQPKRLDRLAIIKSGDWIALQAEVRSTFIADFFETDSLLAEDMLSRNIDIIRNCLVVNVPEVHYNAVVSESIRSFETSTILKSDNSHQTKVFERMIEVLFTQKLTYLNVLPDMFSQFTSWSSKSYLLTDIVHLTLDIYLNPFSGDVDIIQMLKYLNKIKHLKILECTDRILKCIVESCKLLEEFDCEHAIDRNLIYLTELPNLKRLNLFTSKSNTEEVKKIMLSCKNIEDFNIGTDIPNTVFREILDENTNACLNLKKYYDYVHNLEDLKVVAQICPLVEKLDIQSLTSSMLNILMTFQNLRELSLYEIRFQEMENNFLEGIGNNLVYLHLEHVNGMDTNSLMDISRMCPNLQSLSIRSIYPFERHRIDREKLEILPFRNLKTLEWESYDFEANHDEEISFLLSNCVNVEFINIFGSMHLTEDMILNVLEKNSFVYLKRLRISPINITPIKLLINELIKINPNYPEVIAVELNRWTYMNKIKPIQIPF